MKRIMMLILSAVLMMGMMPGCASDAPETTTPETVESTTTVPAGTTDAVAVETTEQKSSEIQVVLLEADHFTEGLAWIKYYDPSARNNDVVGILNQDGLIITSEVWSENDDFGSPFSGGYSYINLPEGGFIIVNSEGDVTFESPDDGTRYEIVCGGDGVYYVYQQVRGMEINEDRYGFVDANGEWLVEPSEDCPITYKNTGYHGNHVFSTLLGKNISIYNVDSGILKKYNSGSNNCLIHLVDEEDQPYRFVDGLLLGYTEECVFTFDLELNINIIEEFEYNSWGDPLVYRNDGIYYYGKGGFDKTSVIRNGAFYDLYGNLLVDFSQYTVITDDVPGFYQFYEGIAAVKIKGADGGHYVGFVDMDGEFTCEPIKVTGTYAYTAGYLLIGDFEGTRMIDNHGNVLNFEHHGVYSDGFAWDEEASVFWDMDGNSLTCYIIEP